MHPDITIEELPRLGDRYDYLVRAVGPGDTDWTFPLSLTGTVVAIWDVAPEQAAKELGQALLRQIGTASQPPQQGFWFDSYNSGPTVRATIDKTWNDSAKRFVKDGHEDPYINRFGGQVFKKIGAVNRAFGERFGQELTRSLDDAFEASQAREDLDSLPQDQAHLLYRVCILSVIVDHFHIFPEGYDLKNGSLNGFEQWLKQQGVAAEKLQELIKPFRMIKKLRKQYPIHEQFEVSQEGIRTLRREIIEAREYYGFDESRHIQDNFHRVLVDFMTALDKLKAFAEESR